MYEIDEFSQKAMLDFLQTYFPIKRLKNGRRFSRGIILDGDFTGLSTRNIFLSPRKEQVHSFMALSRVLEDVFGFPMAEINTVLLKYFNII